MLRSNEEKSRWLNKQKQNHCEAGNAHRTLPSQKLDRGKAVKYKPRTGEPLSKEGLLHSDGLAAGTVCEYIPIFLAGYGY